MTILEGESLINDASALIAYRAAVAAARTGAFSLVDAAVDVRRRRRSAASSSGVVVGVIVTAALSRTADPILEIIVTLIAPITRLPRGRGARRVGRARRRSSPGLITGRRAARVLSPDARLLGVGAWQTVIWLINAFVFMLIGLQLPSIIAGLSTRTRRPAPGPRAWPSA